MVRYIRGFRLGNEYNRVVEGAAEVCWDLFVVSTLDRHEEFIKCRLSILQQISLIEKKSVKFRQSIQDILETPCLIELID